jgi:hypothetical protein
MAAARYLHRLAVRLNFAISEAGVGQLNVFDGQPTEDEGLLPR